MTASPNPFDETRFPSDLDANCSRGRLTRDLPNNKRTKYSFEEKQQGGNQFRLIRILGQREGFPYEIHCYRDGLVADCECGGGVSQEAEAEVSRWHRGFAVLKALIGWWRKLRGFAFGFTFTFSFLAASLSMHQHHLVIFSLIRHAETRNSYL